MKEAAANEDDAGASTIIFCLDHLQYSRQGIMSPRVVSLFIQGRSKLTPVQRSALYVKDATEPNTLQMSGVCYLNPHCVAKLDTYNLARPAAGVRVCSPAHMHNVGLIGSCPVHLQHHV